MNVGGFIDVVFDVMVCFVKGEMCNWVEIVKVMEI